MEKIFHIVLMLRLYFHRGKRMRCEPTGSAEEVPACTPTETRESHLAPPAEISAVMPPFAIESIEKKIPDFTIAGSYPLPSTQPFPPFNNSTQLSSQTDMMFAYFDFLEAETLSHIAPEDFKFLEYKGCFHLPSRPILDELVREYFLHVHPVLPVIDECTFWEMYFPNGRRAVHRKIPLFVFRAMLFVSCSVSDHHVNLDLAFADTVCL
jgi:hypothetical protein